jgi:ATP-binding cassette, subfamily B, bacterial PglK
MLTTFRKLFDLFEARERWQVLALFAAMLVTAVVQAVGVVSVLPFVALVANPEVVTENARLRWVYDSLGFADPRQFLIFTGAAALAVIALSNALSAFTSWLTLRFSWNKNAALEKRLLARYLNEPYAFHLDRNSSQLTKTIFNEVQAVVKGVLMPGLKILSQGTVAVLLLVLLLLVDAVLALVAALVLGGAYGLVYLTIRRGQARRGQKRVELNRQRFKIASEAFGGIKDVKVLGRERAFLKKFGRVSGQYARANASNAMATELPRHLIETVVFGGLIVIVLYLLAARGDIRQVLPVVTLFAVAATRLKPAVQAIYSELGRIRFHQAALNQLHADYMHAEAAPRSTHAGLPPAAEKLTFEREIAVRGLAFRYRSSRAPVLRNLDLRIPRNTTVGFVGSTGSGKTTLVDVILGLLRAHEGHVEVDGVPITEANVRSWQRSIGYVPQHVYLCDDSVSANIAFGVPANEIDHQAVERAARVANIHEFVLSSLPQGYATEVGERGVRLSGGQRQRIGIARALYHDPEVLFFDEATSALDNLTEDAVMAAIQSLAGRKTIVLVAHRLTTLRECDSIFVFKDGKLTAEGTYDQLIHESDDFRRMARVAQAPAIAVR